MIGAKRKLLVSLLLAGGICAGSAWPARFAAAKLPPQEKVTGTVTRVLPDAIELKSGEGKKVFNVPAENRDWLAQVHPGDRVTLWYERDARELHILRRGSRSRQQGGEAPPPGKPIIDDRAFYGAKIHSDTTKPQA